METSNDTPAMTAEANATLNDREEASEAFCISRSCSLRHSASKDGGASSGGTKSTDGECSDGGKMGPRFLMNASDTWSRLVGITILFLSIAVLLLAVSMLVTIARLGS